MAILPFQPTRPLRGATLLTLIRFASLLYFNPRAPCGARPTRHPLIFNLITFQPTRPLRGATTNYRDHLRPCKFQPTRPLRGATVFSIRLILVPIFQPTRPLRGATDCPNDFSLFKVAFQSTRPLRGATRRRCRKARTTSISTHAPLAGRDIIVK